MPCARNRIVGAHCRVALEHCLEIFVGNRFDVSLRRRRNVLFDSSDTLKLCFSDLRRYRLVSEILITHRRATRVSPSCSRQPGDPHRR
jgi:hypothetical protein